ncbi:hypothetical protein G4B88_010495 [Cannabis sativa]|uniref:RNase H type-1 domain-containing protein n=1 Tax=Cannabis sativa TaxID=3483 RepID=A0A7J6I674_CANSA|nr:hypothetical protein G4B88_010495 [Cannabis sativa]
MDELLQKTHNLQVTDEDEEWEVDKSLSITVAKTNLRGRLCTNSDHSRGFLKKVLGGIWRLKDVEWNLKIKEKFDSGMEQQSSLEDTIKQPAIGLEKTPTAATALSSLGDTRIGVTNMRDESKAKQDHLKQSIEGGSISLPRMSGMQSGDIEIGENQIRSDDGSRGKRRIVEDYGDSGYGKLKKSATILSKEFQEHDLFNIPISYSQEAQVLEGSIAFAVGSGSKDLAKENRRKVADKLIVHTLELKNRLGSCGVALQQWNKSKRKEMTRHLKECADKISLLPWHPPEKGSICVNCDAAVHENLIGVGIGFIWRNWEGQIISAGMIYMPSMCTVEMAEAWPIIEAIKRAPTAATGPIEIQSDCRAVVDQLKNQGQYYNAVSTILHQIKDQMDALESVNIIHVKRFNNECANMLARKSLADRTTQLFDHSFPDWLANFCKADLPLLL